MSSFLQKIKYATETAKEVTKGLIEDGEFLTSKEETQSRLDICSGTTSGERCKFFVDSLGTVRCNECGCFAKLKNSLKNAKCPLGKW